eukprot:TRINITY_DN2717_c0_g3_i1.p1 TRINITY_DN2717_c0_g3~~TRINITY_DN2717_c0_g3_i1.p1  ORF type:complete len:692 (-),score=120.97 TRINITY_DN2717_c0_g3_i1:157-2232(-)
MALFEFTAAAFVPTQALPGSLTTAGRMGVLPQSFGHSMGYRRQSCTGTEASVHAQDCGYLACLGASVPSSLSVGGLVASASLAVAVASSASTRMKFKQQGKVRTIFRQRRPERSAITMAQSLQDSEAPVLASNYYEVMRANGVQRMAEETAQDRVFHWLGRGPKPGSECFKALQKNFPGALPGAAIHLRSKAVLAEEHGFTPQNTLLGTSFCPDEINHQKRDIGTLMREHYGNMFPMGGIGGSPYVGETGFKAFASHVAKDGNIILVFGPHVGISESGQIGEYLRQGQSSHTTACGAVIGAYKACMDAVSSNVTTDEDHDMQMDEIKQEFAKHTESLSLAEDPMAACAYQAFEMVKDRILKIANTDFGSGKLVLIGGIQINMPHESMEDYFLPLMFEVQQAGKPASNLMMSFSDPTTQQTLDQASSVSCQRETFAFLTWSPPARSPIYQAMQKHFPGALPSQALHERKRAILKKYGFTSHNTLMGTSLCPDEINNDSSDLPVLMSQHWGESFPMGGISGAPFVGKTGFRAFSSHVPDDGNIIILFGPHVGISAAGEIGCCLRLGQEENSTACGAVIAAYRACLAGDAGDSGPGSYDKQMDWIKQQLAPHVKQIQSEENPMTALSYQSYKMIQGQLEDVVDNDFGTGWLCLVGGIQINLPEGLEDHFLPCTLELRKAGEEPINLLSELMEFK